MNRCNKLAVLFTVIASMLFLTGCTEDARRAKDKRIRDQHAHEKALHAATLANKASIEIQIAQNTIDGKLKASKHESDEKTIRNAANNQMIQTVTPFFIFLAIVGIGIFAKTYKFKKSVDATTQSMEIVERVLKDVNVPPEAKISAAKALPQAQAVLTAQIEHNNKSPLAQLTQG